MNIKELTALWAEQQKIKGTENSVSLAIISSPKKTVAALKSLASVRAQSENEVRILMRGSQVNRKISRGDDADSRSVELVNLNMIHAVADNALTTLVPINPRVSANPLNDEAQKCKLELNGYIANVFNSNNMHGCMSRVAFDALASGYGVYETSFDVDAKQPKIRDIRSNRFFFDLEPRNNEDISWFATVEPVLFYDFVGYIESAAQSEEAIVLTPEALVKIREKAGKYPEWLLDQEERNLKEPILLLQSWITVWRLYDVVNDRMLVYVEDGDVIAIDQPMPSLDGKMFIPFVISNLTTDGHSNTGIADCKTILPHQRRLTDYHRLMDEIASQQQPEIWADGNIVKEADLKKPKNHSAGNVKILNVGNDANAFGELAKAFFVKPVPTFTNELLTQENHVREMIGYTSTISDTLRGQVANIRTATEAAQIETNTQNRLGSRRRNLFTAVEQVAEKVLQIARSNYVSDIELTVLANGSGNMEKRTLALSALKAGEVKFEMVGYNPARQNPAVIVEMLHNNAAFFGQALPKENMAALVTYLLKELGAPVEVYTMAESPPAPEQGAAQNPLAALMGGGTGEPPPNVAPSDLPLPNVPEMPPTE